MGTPIGPTDALSTVISADSEVFSKGDMVQGLVTMALGSLPQRLHFLICKVGDKAKMNRVCAFCRVRPNVLRKQGRVGKHKKQWEKLLFFECQLCAKHFVNVISIVH